MMLRRALILSCVGLLTVLLASCGQSYEVQSITVTDADNFVLTGLGVGDQLTVTANYSNSKTAVVTTKASYNGVEASANPVSGAAPNGAVTVNNSGIAVDSTELACTYAPPVSGGATTYTPYPYIANVSYTENGVTVSASVPINVAITGSGCDGK
jgi:hypothetical protein